MKTACQNCSREERKMCIKRVKQTERSKIMFTEKPVIEAVTAFFDNVAVYVHTGEEDDVLFPMEVFKMDELRTGDYRYVVDMPELLGEIKCLSDI